MNWSSIASIAAGISGLCGLLGFLIFAALRLGDQRSSRSYLTPELIRELKNHNIDPSQAQKLTPKKLAQWLEVQDGISRGLIDKVSTLR